MSVYVDPLLRHGGSGSFRWEYSCHMYADTEAELHAMARSIGMKRAWFQPDGGRLPHYDLVGTKRKKAVEMGAIEHTSEQCGQFIRNRRGAAEPSLFEGGQ